MPPGRPEHEKRSALWHIFGQASISVRLDIERGPVVSPGLALGLPSAFPFKLLALLAPPGLPVGWLFGALPKKLRFFFLR